MCWGRLELRASLGTPPRPAVPVPCAAHALNPKARSTRTGDLSSDLWCTCASGFTIETCLQLGWGALTHSHSHGVPDRRGAHPQYTPETFNPRSTIRTDGCRQPLGRVPNSVTCTGAAQKTFQSHNYVNVIMRLGRGVNRLVSSAGRIGKPYGCIGKHPCVSGRDLETRRRRHPGGRCHRLTPGSLPWILHGFQY
jgi:hypothetical protein